MEEKLKIPDREYRGDKKERGPQKGFIHRACKCLSCILIDPVLVLRKIFLFFHGVKVKLGRNAFTEIEIHKCKLLRVLWRKGDTKEGTMK